MLVSVLYAIDTAEADRWTLRLQTQTKGEHEVDPLATISRHFRQAFDSMEIEVDCEMSDDEEIVEGEEEMTDAGEMADEEMMNQGEIAQDDEESEVEEASDADNERAVPATQPYPEVILDCIHVR